jgi:Tol biopolymer transport system component
MRSRFTSGFAALASAIALASLGCGGFGSAEECEPARATIAFDNHPDGNLDVNELHLINPDGTGRRLLVENGYSPEWSPDGCSIAFVRDGLYVVDAAGGPPKKLTANPPGAGSHAVIAAAWAPEGERIALSLSGEEGPTAAPEQTFYIDVLDSDGSGRRRLVPFRADEPTWSPDGERIAFTRHFTIDSSDIYVVDADGSDLRRLTRRSSRSPGANSPAWSPDGRRIAFVRWPDQRNDLFTGAEIYVVDTDGGGPRRVTARPLESPGDFGPVWSPDGKRIAFVRASEQDVTDVYVVNPDGSGLRRLTRTGDASEPAWSADGRTIAFSRRITSGQFEQGDLYVIDAEGGGLRRLTTSPRLVESGPVWAPA